MSLPPDGLAALQTVLHPLHTPPESEPWNLAELADLLPPAPLADAAVLVGLVPRAQGTQLLLTRRHAGMRQHAGQIAFPGGRLDADDAGPVAAALRETQEEVGIAAELIRPLGFLDPYATITGFRVLPVVAVLDPAHVTRLQPEEVDEAFEVPLAFLLDPASSVRIGAEFRGRLRHYWQFEFGGHRIWGATAAMLLNLRAFVARIPPPVDA